MRERRHPHQVLDVSGLTVGARYAFVRAYPDSGASACVRVMAGVVSNTVEQAARLGWAIEDYRKRSGIGFKVSMPIDALLGDRVASVGGFADVEMVTVHRDGWSEFHKEEDRPTLAYWTAGGMLRGWDYVITYLGYPEPESGATRIVVPEDDWLAAPTLRRMPYEPNSRVEPDESPANFEQRMRAKRDETMRVLFGY